MKPARGSEGKLGAPPVGRGRARSTNGLGAFRGENRPLMSGNSSDRRGLQTTNFITSHKVDQNFGGVRHPNLNLWGCQDSHDTQSCCAQQINNTTTAQFEGITSSSAIAEIALRDRSVLANSGLWKTIFCRHYRSIYNHCDVIGLQSYQIRRNNAK